MSSKISRTFSDIAEQKDRIDIQWLCTDCVAGEEELVRARKDEFPSAREARHAKVYC